MRFAIAAVSLFCIGFVLFDVFEVMLLPRRVRRRARLVRIFFRSSWSVWSKVALRMSPEQGRETVLSFFGPFSMVLLIGFWVLILIGAFGFLQWTLEPSEPFAQRLYLSGATFFTLGYGDVTPHTWASRIVAIWEAGTGFAFIAVVIGYLPVLYQLFSDREVQVIQLDARAGSPPSAVTLLTRHAESEDFERLYSLLEKWEEWAAETVESHLSYPMLSYYRSQHDNQSWLAAVCAILDSCAMILTGFRGVKTFHARMAFATSRLAVMELASVLSIRPRTAEPPRLPASGFAELSDRLGNAGLFFSGEDAEEKLAAFRATYEPFLAGLSDYLLLPLPGWLPNETLDNWQNSPRGRSAKQLVEDAPAHPD